MVEADSGRQSGASLTITTLLIPNSGRSSMATTDKSCPAD